MKNVYYITDSESYDWMVDQFNVVDTIENADIVIIAGHRNIHPEVGGFEDVADTESNYKRDVHEMGEYYRALDCPNVKLIVGINSGASLLCALNGGNLIQYVDNHDLFGLHLITNGTDEMLITSTHQQMQYPYNLPNRDYEVLFWTSPSRGEVYKGVDIDLVKEASFKEPEIVLYKGGDKKCLAITGDHYRMNPKTSTFKFINKLINEYAE